MSATQPRSYKGFELQPLVFSRTFERFDGHSRYAQGYDVAVRICRTGAAGATATGKVFRIEGQDAFADFGTARRAAYQRGEDIIDGKIEGASANDL